ncbi:putative membrane protein YgcG [Actinoplanes lutulentus]|uniref:Uncharacterized protein n=1 Tax=Actinoplanes lutulentus TaxID=1287878 RepID=A0A327Z2A6_9ACTN|nr:hypothetical protein [Actinoplanes lutulentus]MBB2948595.1 putative membrane protein YgcG [Actinoplanes lutulentus]RAK28034.1 hypothetical protein B0I29_121130 [Actinoplanes lutulentus]
MQWFLLAAGIAAVASVLVYLLTLTRRRRAARPLSRDERLAAARSAGQGLRRSASRKPSRADHLGSGSNTGYAGYHSPGFGGGSDGGGGGGGGD